MKRFSPFVLLISGLSLSLHAGAQGSSSIAGSLVARQPAAAAGVMLVAMPARHSSQLPAECSNSAPVPALLTAPAGQSAAAGVVSELQLPELLEIIRVQQARLDALQAETEAAIRRANRAEAATVAFEQRLRQLEAAGSRPGFWR